ncbi:MAG: haloacid dehalogenase type II [Candidatus Latescibacteria bacterium]|nr:haloacid dehalogenase type II [Candidatus Latescibacterota bacterium]
MAKFPAVQALTFDLFGTVLDLGGSLTPYIADYLRDKESQVPAERLWDHWRSRQRLEQYQDNILMLGHSGYLETVRRALVYVLALENIDIAEGDVERLMAAWQELRPFADVRQALEKLQTRYRLVALSNGEADFLAHLAHNRIGWEFDRIISVEEVGAFKPHPGVYRRAAQALRLEMGQCLMVSANSFDVMGARACGMRGAFVNRNGLPYEETSFRPDVEVGNFTELAAALV